jgi:hypothetical protein
MAPSAPKKRKTNSLMPTAEITAGPARRKFDLFPTEGDCTSIAF